jgi:hypothetical protein
VQAVPPAYLLIDFQIRLNALQAVAVGRLLENRFGQIEIEFGGEARSFVDGRRVASNGILGRLGG